MTETEKPQGTSVVPPTIPIRNVNVPDPTGGSEPETKESVEGANGHEAFEKAKAEPEAREIVATDTLQTLTICSRRRLLLKVVGLFDAALA